MRLEEVQDTPIGTPIIFREFQLDRHEKKIPTIQLECIFRLYIPANQKLNVEVLEQYYGEGLDETTYQVLSTAPFPRILVGIEEQDRAEKLKVLNLVPYFFSVGLQEIEVVEFKPTTHISYTY